MAVLERWKPAPELRPYLLYSVGLHIALGAVALGGMNWTGASKQAAIYSIDFVGGPAVVSSSSGGGAAAEEKKEEPTPAAADRSPQRDVDEFGRRRKKGRFVLPRPSLLRGLSSKKEEKNEQRPSAELPAPGTGTDARSNAGAGSSAGLGVASDMPDFPYPWYITQVRQALWNLWSQRMPRGAGESVVVFSIMPNGEVVDLRTEVSSGDSSFDLTALGAAQDAAPFPPLPRGFSEPFLKIHVTLKSGG